MNTPHRAVLFFLTAAASVAVLTAGCSQDPTQGYSLQSQYDPEIRTVAVDVFTRGKDVYRRDIEMRLTEAVIKRIEQDTPLKVTDKARADTHLSGTLNVISQRVLSFDPDTSLPRELEMTLRISILWKDLRSGQILLDQPNLHVSGSYVRLEPLAEEFFEGSQDVLNRAAVRIVEAMETDW